jgi:hypothetical protein
MATHDIAISVGVALWVISFAAPLVIPGVHIDSNLILVLMAFVGGLVVLRERRERTS